MKEIELLEMELKLMQENLNQLKELKNQHKDSKYLPSSSQAFGELKHRSICLKRRLTSIQSLNTYDFLKD